MNAKLAVLPYNPPLYPQASAESEREAHPVLFDFESEVIEGEVIELGGLASAPPAVFADIDVLEMWLRVKTSPATRRNYRADVSAFFDVQFACQPTPANVLKFLGLRQRDMKFAFDEFAVAMREKGLSPATMKRRLAAVRSLVIYANGLELCRIDGRLLKDSIKIETYRDTAGIDRAKIKKLFAQPGKKHGKTRPVHARRDTAILVLLYENALRRSEIVNMNVGDFDFSSRCVWIIGKGREQRERISLTGYAVGAIQAYLDGNGHGGDKGPLFRNFDRRTKGERLTADGLYGIIKEYGADIGVKGFRPHKMRHAAITHALDATGGNLREVAKLSRHKKWDTLKIYDDNREDFQGKMSNLLSGLHR